MRQGARDYVMKPINEKNSSQNRGAWLAMARKNSLREYQTAVAERLRNLSKEEPSALSKLGFLAGGHFWFVALHDVSEVIPVPPVAPVPLTKPYFCGSPTSEEVSTA